MIGRVVRRGLSTGCASTTPTGCATRRRTSTTWPSSPAAPTCWSRRSSSRARRCPRRWATAGTTGYDVLALIDRVLTDPAGEAPLTELEDRLRGAPVDWHALVHDNKRHVADGILRSEVLRIGRELRVALTDAPADTEDAVAELLACFPVYRSYLPEGREHLERALAAARPHRPDLAATLDVLAPVLGDPEAAPALRFQQTSGMVMAKGVEDTSFYRWSRLTSLNEVGGDPSVFAVDVDDFHDAMAARQRDWPAAMTTLVHPRHQARRGRPGPDHRARRGPRPLGGRARRAAARWCRCRTRASATCCGRRSSAPGRRWPPRRPARAAARLRREGDARGRRPDHLDRAGRRLRGRGARAPSTRPSTTPGVRRRARRPARAASPTPGWSNALAAKLVAPDDPRACPTSTRAASCGSRAWSTPTTGARSTSTCRAALLAELDAGARPGSPAASTTPARPSCWSPARRSRLRRDRPELFASYAPLARDGRGRRARARLRPRRRGHRRHPAAARARGPRRLGRHAARAAGRATWVRRGRAVARSVPATVLLADLLADHPVALLVRETPAEHAPASARTVASTCGRRGRSACGCSVAGPTSSRWSAAPTAGGARRGRCPTADGGGRLRLPPRRRPEPQARPAVAPAARRGARAVAHVRRDGVRLDGRRLDRPAARRGRRSTSCTSAPSPRRARFDAALGKLDHLQARSASTSSS